jgi:hypothetical protein
VTAVEPNATSFQTTPSALFPSQPSAVRHTTFGLCASPFS